MCRAVVDKHDVVSIDRLLGVAGLAAVVLAEEAPGRLRRGISDVAVDVGASGRLDGPEDCFGKASLGDPPR
eukprot:4997828-Pyramimonas_sp.AAC.1